MTMSTSFRDKFIDCQHRGEVKVLPDPICTFIREYLEAKTHILDR